ncbi:MAG: hypothetical protein Q8Q31_05690 [Nanoarchaeota archaeon]|nr:hypothetical protein [Nanoarchaeota archaeon]
MNIPEFWAKDPIMRLVDPRSPEDESPVYQLTPNLVGKFIDFREDPTILRRLHREHAVACALRREGVSVPFPLGIFQVELPVQFPYGSGPGSKYPAFVMEYIEGPTLYKGIIHPSEKFDLVQSLADKELTKARRLGFIPFDLGASNVIWSEVQQKVYLIDFYRWKRKTSSAGISK